MFGVQTYEGMTPVVPCYRNPADPSWDYDPAFANFRTKCSYAANMYAMDGSISLTLIALAITYVIIATPKYTASAELMIDTRKNQLMEAQQVTTEAELVALISAV